MTPIDLFDYIHARKKIPARVLKHQAPQAKEVSSYQIISSHMIDAMVIVGVTFMASTITALAAQSFMITPALSSAFSKIHFSSFVTSLLPLIFSTYFFASYFFNHGQTVGMSYLKTRIDMPDKSFRSSVFWGFFSAGAVMSGGLTLLSYQWLQTKGWGQYKEHDHLYFNLVAERDISPVDLVAMTEAFHQLPAIPQEEETYLEAA